MLITLREAESRSGVSRRVLWIAIRLGELPARYIGGSRGWMVLPDALDDWMRGEYCAARSKNKKGAKNDR